MFNNNPNKYFKRILSVILILFSIVIICVTYFNYSPEKFYTLREYFNKNSVSIKVNDNLNIKNVDMYWSSDFKSGQVVKSGKITDLVFKEYGPNKFVILYAKDTIKEFIYGKTNNWHGHKHLILLSKKDNQNIEVEVKIIGPDIIKN